jgi:catechol 2,3-dioxygenase-like lactoylglutathione lyase family enzyme
VERVLVNALDHVALWVAGRDAIAGFTTAHLGMHVIERTEKFTLLGADARRGKLTLFDAEGPRERGALKHVALRVPDVDAASAELPDGVAVERGPGGIYFEVGEGLQVGLVEDADGLPYDLDHVALFSVAPRDTAEQWVPLGFGTAAAGESGAPRVEAGGAFVEFHGGAPGDPERPLLNHLGVLVDSADEWRANADDLGVEVADVVDAANTYAVFVWGPERVKLEYVEHKPTFSLV